MLHILRLRGSTSIGGLRAALERGARDSSDQCAISAWARNPARGLDHAKAITAELKADHLDGAASLL
jgi:hypothetical protein